MRAKSQERHDKCLLLYPPFCFTEMRRRLLKLRHTPAVPWRPEHDRNVPIPVPPHGQKRDVCFLIREGMSAPRQRTEISPPNKFFHNHSRQCSGAKCANESGHRYTTSLPQPPILTASSCLKVLFCIGCSTLANQLGGFAAK